jgi:hypothetical protein
VSRLFDGVDDQVQWSIGGCNLTGALTLACVIKLDAGVSWQSYLGNDHATTGSDLAMSRWSTGEIGMVRGGGAGGASKAITHSSSDGWMLIAVTKASGTTTPTFHKYPIGGSPTHTAGDSTLATFSTQATVVFGQIDGADFFKGRLFACAEFATALSNADIESLVTTFTRTNWLAKGAVGLWDENDAFATDHTGNGASRTLLTGTTDDADDPADAAGWAAGPTQAFLPDADTTTTGWTTTPLFSKINDASDATVITGPLG